MGKGKSRRRQTFTEFKVIERSAALDTADVLPSFDGLLPKAEWHDFVHAANQRTEKAIRLRLDAAYGDRQKLDIPFTTDQVPWFEHGRFAKDEYQPGRYLQHASGGYFVQDAGSMLALKVLDAQPDEQVADVCAAPGGKATSILEIVGPGTGFLLSNEPIRGRTAALQWTLGRVGFGRYAITQYDVEKLRDQLEGQFDAVLVDAPCTGQAMVGRGKQTLAAFDVEKVNHASSRQQRILLAAADLVREGGRIVYSTCTFAPEENEHVVSALLATSNEWTEVEYPELQAWRSPLAPGGYRLWPHRDRCAGAYAICLRRNSASQSNSGRAPKAIWTPQMNPPELRKCLDDVGFVAATQFRQAGQQWFGWPIDSPQWIQQVEASGPEIMYQPAKTWLPAYGLAMRRDRGFVPLDTIDLCDELAGRYLQGNSLQSYGQGWKVASWRQNPLGWIHSNPSRSNNALPAAARLNYNPISTA